LTDPPVQSTGDSSVLSIVKEPFACFGITLNSLAVCD
jgi:hypothetical protein